MKTKFKIYLKYVATAVFLFALVANVKYTMSDSFIINTDFAMAQEDTSEEDTSEEDTSEEDTSEEDTSSSNVDFWRPKVKSCSVTYYDEACECYVTMAGTHTVCPADAVAQPCEATSCQVE